METSSNELILEIYKNIENYNFEEKLKNIIIIKARDIIKYNAINSFPNVIISTTFKYLNIDIGHNDKVRKRELVDARQIAFYLMKKHTKLSLRVIGSFFNKDHATVLHACKTIDNLIETDKFIRKDVNDIEKLIFEKL